MLTIRSQCRICGGDGVDKEKTGPGGDMSVPCAACKGVGYFEDITIDDSELTTALDDIMDKLNDVSDKCDDIFEKVNV